MKNFLLHIIKEEEAYLSHVKPLIPVGVKVPLSSVVPVTVMELVLKTKEKGCNQVATTSEVLLKLLLDGKLSKKNDYRGVIIEKFGCEFLILPPLEHLFTVSYGKFLFKRYISKFIEPDRFFAPPEFKFVVFEPKLTDELLDYCAEATFIAVDIETGNEQDRIITCVGFTAVKLDSARGTVESTTFVVPFLDEYNIAFIRTICSFSCQKVFQNGQYDNSYLLRFNIPVSNWSGDTINLFHSWYSELPKRLDFLTSFLLRRWSFWKDEAKTQIHSHDYYQYNAKDSFATAYCWLALLQEVPQYALDNYCMEFPVTFPCLLASLTGLRRDNDAMDAEEKRFLLSLDLQLQSIRKMIATPTYNPSSPQQTVKLIAALGSGDITSSGKIPLDKVMARHPLNKRIFTAITKYREDRKLTGTYLRDEDPKDGSRKSWHGRIFYSLYPHGTDTGRIASKESVFWCGWQIHNIPRDRPDIQVRRGIISDPGFFIGECDRAQAETRDTAYLSGDKKLIMAVDRKDRDFHGHNASAFFGVSYSEIVQSIYDDEIGEWEHKTKDKPLRDLSKRTNHGANYNMGAGVLLDTMGIEAVIRARTLLNLPRQWKLIEVCQHLLDIFSKTYATMKGPWYDKCISDVMGSHLLIGPTGWTRYCFGNPKQNKRDLNAYVAHPPQSLNAMELNTAYMRVFYQVALPNPRDFKLGPQIHDSILFQYRRGRVDLAYAVQECMHNPIKITDTFGIKRILEVPTDLKGEAERWSEVTPLRQPRKVQKLEVAAQ
jgi:hypothetical protein